MTATAPRFDRSAILKAAWVSARRLMALGTSLRLALSSGLAEAWERAKNPATQKSIARILDTAASRAGRAAASSRQCWFLAALMLQAGEDGSDYLLDTSRALTIREASSMIDFYLGKH